MDQTQPTASNEPVNEHAQTAGTGQSTPVPQVQLSPDSLKDIESELRRLESQNFGDTSEQTSAQSIPVTIVETPIEAPVAAPAPIAIPVSEPIVAEMPAAEPQNVSIPVVEQVTPTTEVVDLSGIEHAPSTTYEAPLSQHVEPVSVSVSVVEQSVPMSTPEVAPVVVEAPLAQPPDEMRIELPATEATSESPVETSPQTDGLVGGDVVSPDATPEVSESALPLNVITGEPEAPVAAMAAMSAAATAPAKPHMSKPKHFLLFFVVGALLALMVAVAVAAYLLQPKKKPAAETQNVPISLVSRSIAATSLDDYAGVCDKSTISNAGTYSATDTKSHSTLVFEQNGSKYSRINAGLNDPSLQAVSTDLALVQLVGCVSRDTSFAGSLLKTCALADANKVTVNVDYLSARYNVDIFEAKSGKQIGTKAITTTTDKCPDTAVFTTPDPKVYARAEIADIESAVVAFSAKK